MEGWGGGGGGLVEASPPASSVEHMPGTTSAMGGNGTQLVWLGSGLNRPCLCHQCSRSSHTHVNCAHTRETDWNLPDSFPIKHQITLRQIKGRCCFVRWVSMSNERARARHSTSYFEFQRMPVKGSIFRELIVGCRMVGDSLCAKDKYIYSCGNALAMHSLIPGTLAKGCNTETQGAWKVDVEHLRRGDAGTERLLCNLTNRRWLAYVCQI